MFDVIVQSAFDFASAEYAAFYAASGASAFQHPLWLKTLYAMLLGRGAEPLVIVVRDDGRLVMVLPLVRRRLGPVRIVEFADFGVSDYGAPVASPADFLTLAGDLRACAAIQDALRPYDLLRLRKLPEGGLSIHRLLGATDPVPMGTNAYAVGLTSDFDAWRRRSLNPSYRKELDKKGRQLDRKGAVRFERVADAERLEVVFERMRHYRRLRFTGREGRDLLQLESHFGFYRQVAREGMAAGAARTYALSVDGEPVACVFGIAVGGRFLVLLGGFDQIRFKNQSLGALMFERVAADCIASGDAVLDFTIGDEPYKLTFGAQPTPMWMVTRAGTPLGWLASAALARLPKVRALLRRRPRDDRRPPANPVPAEGAPIVLGDGEQGRPAPSA